MSGRICDRCAGYDPHCSRCVSSRLARKHGTEYSLGTGVKATAAYQGHQYAVVLEHFRATGLEGVFRDSDAVFIEADRERLIAEARD